MKKVLSSILALAMLLCALVSIITVDTLAADEPPTSGQCGDDVWYTYDSNTHMLTIFGTGPMWDFEIIPRISSNRPWNEWVKTVVVKEGVTSIGDMAFYETRIESIQLPESLESIGDKAFHMGDNLIAEITIPKNVRFIGTNAFTYTEIKEFQVGAQNKWFRSVGGVLFTVDMKTLITYPCASQTKHYAVPQGVEIIKESAFYPRGSRYLETISFPDSLRIIEMSAFQEQRGLRDVHLPPNLEYLGRGCFLVVNSFSCIEIPATMIEIENEAFFAIKDLNEIYFLGAPPILGEEIYWLAPEDLTLYYPTVLADAWAPNGEITYQGYNIAPYSYERGDANCDGKVSAADAAAILRHLVKLTPLFLRGIKVADVTGDGQITAADAARILRWLVRLESSL